MGINALVLFYTCVYICSLQKFKLNLANTVISQENSSLLSMNTSELLDLFQLTDAGELTTKGGVKVTTVLSVSVSVSHDTTMIIIDLLDLLS